MVLVGTGWHKDVGEDLERCPQALERDVGASMNFGAVLELPMTVDVPIAGFLKPVEAPEPPGLRVRPNLL
jgi:hypothetical protein